MDLHHNSDPEVIVLSALDNADIAGPTQYPGVVSPEASKRARKAKPFIKSFNFLPSLLKGSFKTSGTSETHTRRYSEKMGRQIADHRSVTNYTYVINGGRGGSGGEGGDQGGDGGAGHGPTVYFGQPEVREPSAFRTIRRGDVKLVGKEVAVRRQGLGVGVRRTVHHAEIRGNPGTVTVVMYQGDGAEKEWREHIVKYESIWDPRIMQLYGLVSTKGLYAMVFHDELIPYGQFLRRFEHSPILSLYIIGYCSIIETTEFEEATKYINSVIGPWMKTSVWIRPSTGEVCLDLVAGGPETSFELPWLHPDVLRLENVSLDGPGSEDIIISSLSEDQYHQLCSQNLTAESQYFQVSTEHPIGLGVFRVDSQYGICMRITEPLQLLPEEELNWYNYGNAPDELLPNSWIRYDFPRMFALKLELNLWFPPYKIHKAWLAQANHIFAELQELEHVEDYVCVYRAQLILQIPYKWDIPTGYLFICPPDDFRTDTEPHAHVYKWPACPAYWSLSPSGADRLSTEDARILGFPAIHIETVMDGYSWDRSVYEGLHRFHEGKGFNPESQEVARQLGYPLFEVLNDCTPFPARKVNNGQLWPGWCEEDDPTLCRKLGHYL
ncbi:hypothetical protein MSAN_02445900 [Mycena sanguinolenta]|uniref:Uncharacterized protein n=1 Tax=Mycena sanguinolenta TaxID=230812 RepID=A0A8H7CCR2_9AGAR|nr:hypothetical protein MSAN_02445900 [Mycena sanguinolenta]